MKTDNNTTRTTSYNITELKENEIFVFGSNLGGKHGAGAAKFAHKRFGAVYGCGEGLQGRCYAIPTKGYRMEVLPLDTVRRFVQKFLRYAACSSDCTFLVTKIGCGLAGYETRDIAPMFEKRPENVILPQEFLDQL